MMRKLFTTFVCSLCSLFFVSGSGVLNAQYAALNAADAALQDRAIAAERRAQFHETWSFASPERRSIVRALFERRAQASSADRDQPRLALLALGTRVLMGAEGARIQNDSLVRLADGIDVFCSPVDLKAAQGPEEGQVITVGVRLLKPMTSLEFPAGQVSLKLAWESADGALMDARAGVFSREEFNQGIPVSIRTPPLASGVWFLIPILECDQKTVHGWRAPVPFVSDFQARMTRLQSGTQLMAELAYVLKWGRIWVRRRDRLGPDEWLRRMEAGEVGGSRWSADRFLARPSASRPTVLLVASPSESAAELLSGPIGAAWLEQAARHDFHLACADASELVAAKLQAGLLDLLAATGGKEVILVARGDAALSVSLSLPLAPTPNLRGLVLVNSFGAPSSKVNQLPTLLVGCGGDPSLDGSHITRSASPGTLLLADTILPQAFAEWFAERWE